MAIVGGGHIPTVGPALHSARRPASIPVYLRGMHMKFRLPLVAALALLAGACSHSDPQGGASSSGAARSASAATANAPGGVGRSALARGYRTRFAAAPDHGALVSYPQAAVVRRDGAYTSYLASVSEAHARDAIGGVLTLPLPTGGQLRFRYERHVEHPNGDWTWIGGAIGEKGEQAIITFGEKAAFGTIGQAGAQPWRLTVQNGVSWLIRTDAAQLATINNGATRPTSPDYLVPPGQLPGAGHRTAGSGAMTAAPATAAAATTGTAANTVDLVIGYTPGFVGYYGGDSQAQTRLNNMVDITNEAYVNSGVDARVRLVKTLQVSYADNTSNDSALEALTGFKAPSTQTTPDPAFSALRAARDQYGADLVSLVRRFQTPENDGCGIAWLIGGGQSTIDNSDEFFGYSVVSDGRDAGTDGKNYYCREETLAHELGHNMGAQHDRATAQGSDGTLSNSEYGRYPYSFGYKTTSTTGNFYTIMAYGDSGQTTYRIFSNPRSTFCGGLACGVDNQADNARSLSQTIPLIAGFRGTVVPNAPAYVAPALLAIGKTGSSGRTEMHRLTSASGFKDFDAHIASVLGSTGQDFSWRLLAGDFNKDGVQDIYAIGRAAVSTRTEVHVLDGASGYQTFLAHIATGLGRTGSAYDWDFALADYNGDGALDLYCIYKTGGAGRTEVHVLNGANGFQSFLLNVSSALGATGSDGAWMFQVGDMNGDSRPDIFAIGKNGASGSTELHVLDGANAYQSFLLHRATALGATGASYLWSFLLGDSDGDGVLDLYCIYRGGTSGTEIHVLNGATSFGTFSFHGVSGLGRVADNGAWEFQLIR
jgi:hypothetical protein